MQQAVHHQCDEDRHGESVAHIVDFRAADDAAEGSIEWIGDGTDELGKAIRAGADKNEHQPDEEQRVEQPEQVVDELGEPGEPTGPSGDWYHRCVGHNASWYALWEGTRKVPDRARNDTPSM